MSTVFRLVERRLYLNAGCIFGDIDDLRRKRRGTRPVAMMHDLAQRLSDPSSFGDGHVFPELIRLDPLDDLRLLADRIEVHLECRQAIQQIDLQIGDGAGFSKHCDLHARHEQIERVGVAIAADIAPLHQRRDLLPKHRDGGRSERLQA